MSREFADVPAMLKALTPSYPVYCLRPHVIAATARRFLDLFPGRVLYAVKCNPHPLVLRALYDAGIRHFDTASLPEIALGTALVLGTVQVADGDLSAGTLVAFLSTALALRCWWAFGLAGYARIDMRLDDAGKVYVLEANPNPQIAYGEDFAESAEHAGMKYEALLDRILALGRQWNPERVA